MAAEHTVDIAMGWTPEPGRSMSLHADAYTRQRWFDLDQRQIIARTWQWVCHRERLAEPGAYVTEDIVGMPIVAVRGRDGELRAFYNVCQHRAHHLVEGSGTIANIGSVSGIFVTPFAGAYCASKAAVHALSDAWRLELAPFGIQVVTVQPGAIVSNFGEVASRTARQHGPQGKLCTS